MLPVKLDVSAISLPEWVPPGIYLTGDVMPMITRAGVPHFYSKCVSCSVVSNSSPPYGLWSVHQALCPWNSQGKNTGVGSHFLLQGIFPSQGFNPSLLKCRWIFFHLSHQRRSHLLLKELCILSLCPSKARTYKDEKFLIIGKRFKE